jgi:hypothetical protein
MRLIGAVNCGVLPIRRSLQVKTRSVRKRLGVSPVPPIETNAPNMLWTNDFQFDFHDRRRGHQDLPR